MPTLTVVDFKRPEEGWRDTIKTLRRIADDMEAGEMPVANIGLLILMYPNLEMDSFGFGKNATPLEVLGMLKLVERGVVDSIGVCEEPNG